MSALERTGRDLEQARSALAALDEQLTESRAKTQDAKGTAEVAARELAKDPSSKTAVKDSRDARAALSDCEAVEVGLMQLVQSAALRVGAAERAHDAAIREAGAVERERDLTAAAELLRRKLDLERQARAIGQEIGAILFQICGGDPGSPALQGEAIEINNEIRRRAGLPATDWAGRPVDAEGRPLAA